MKAVPPVLCIPTGSLPGYEFGVCSESAVRDGVVKSMCSLGNGTKPFVSSSITQLSQHARSLLSKLDLEG